MNLPSDRQMRTAKEAGEYLEQIVKQRGKTAEDLAVLLNTTVEKINGCLDVSRKFVFRQEVIFHHSYYECSPSLYFFRFSNNLAILVMT